MSRAVRDRVRARAHGRCEYCRLPDALAALVSFHVEHIIARQHGGGATADNLCWSCHRCNWSKGPNLAGIDPVSGRLVALFHPRRQRWGRHFRWEGPVLVGLTRIGRATIAVLDMNHPQRVELRRHLIAAGEFP
jgi:hypothetical protein